MTIVMFGGKRGRLASQRIPSQPWSTGVAASCCGGALLQEGLVSFTKWMASWVDILKQHLKTSVRKLKLRHKWVFQMNNDPNHISKAKCLKDNEGIEVAITKLWPQSYRTFVGRTESVCEQGGLKTLLRYTSSVRRNGPKLTQLIVGSLWKATRHVSPKINHLKGMLPNTNWVYVNFWPTGNVMKEIKAEINYSLCYYSDISHS